MNDLPLMMTVFGSYYLLEIIFFIIYITGARKQVPTGRGTFTMEYYSDKGEMLPQMAKWKLYKGIMCSKASQGDKYWTFI